MTASNNPTLAAALAFADRGQPVFLCGSNKAPLTPHGYKDATTDHDIIRKWLYDPDGKLIGLPTGIKFFVLDIDCKKGVNGLLTLETLQNGENFSVGPMQMTPSGGYHMFWDLPPDMIVPSNAGQIGPGLDLRGVGGCLLYTSPSPRDRTRSRMPSSA